LGQALIYNGNHGRCWVAAFNRLSDLCA
jgi:hypothetical protein